MRLAGGEIQDGATRPVLQCSHNKPEAPTGREDYRQWGLLFLNYTVLGLDLSIALGKLFRLLHPVSADHLYHGGGLLYRRFLVVFLHLAKYMAAVV